MDLLKRSRNQQGVYSEIGEIIVVNPPRETCEVSTQEMTGGINIVWRSLSVKPTAIRRVILSITA